jgi:hypothetical protein
MGIHIGSDRDEPGTMGHLGGGSGQDAYYDTVGLVAGADSLGSGERAGCHISAAVRRSPGAGHVLPDGPETGRQAGGLTALGQPAVTGLPLSDPGELPEQRRLGKAVSLRGATEVFQAGR